MMTMTAEEGQSMIAKAHPGEQKMKLLSNYA
jgi:hypothetical protein